MQINNLSQNIIDDEILIKAAKADSMEFAALYNKYYPAMCRFAYQRLQSKQDAYDIVAISFCKAFQNIDKYKFNGVLFSSWLYKIVLNELNQQHRNNKIKRVINCDDAALINISEEIPDENKIENLGKLKLCIQQ